MQTIPVTPPSILVSSRLLGHMLCQPYLAWTFFLKSWGLMMTLNVRQDWDCFTCWIKLTRASPAVFLSLWYLWVDDDDDEDEGEGDDDDDDDDDDVDDGWWWWWWWGWGWGWWWWWWWWWMMMMMMMMMIMMMTIMMTNISLYLHCSRLFLITDLTVGGVCSIASPKEV